MLDSRLNEHHDLTPSAFPRMPLSVELISPGDVLGQPQGFARVILTDGTLFTPHNQELKAVDRLAYTGLVKVTGATFIVVIFLETDLNRHTWYRVETLALCETPDYVALENQLRAFQQRFKYAAMVPLDPTDCVPLAPEGQLHSHEESKFAGAPT